MRQILAVITFFAALSAAPVSAQTMPPACDGDIAIVRVTQIKPTSSVGAYMTAQAAHLAWYRKQGFTNNQIYSSRVIVTDPATKSMKYSDTDVVAFHVRPPSSGGTSIAAKDQAGWDAYVKRYRDSSEIKSEYMVCWPKGR